MMLSNKWSCKVYSTKEMKQHMRYQSKKIYVYETYIISTSEINKSISQHGRLLHNSTTETELSGPLDYSNHDNIIELCISCLNNQKRIHRSWIKVFLIGCFLRLDIATPDHGNIPQLWHLSSIKHTLSTENWADFIQVPWKWHTCGEFTMAIDGRNDVLCNYNRVIRRPCLQHYSMIF